MARRDGTTGREDAEEVLSPEELDIAADENVAILDSGRYVVGASGPPNEDKVEQVREELADAAGTIPDDGEADPDANDGEDSVAAPAPEANGSGVSRDRIDGRRVKAWIDDQLASTDTRYAYRIAAKSGDRFGHQQLATDDVGTAFDALLLWYAQQLGDGTAIEEALGILLAESSIRVRYPTQRLHDYLEEHDIDPDDSIADLMYTVRDEDGLVFPPPRRNQE